MATEEEEAVFVEATASVGAFLVENVTPPGKWTCRRAMDEPIPGRRIVFRDSLFLRRDALD